MKKGMQATYAVTGFILLVLVLLMLVGLLVVLRDAFSATEDSLRCGTEVMAHAAASRFTSGVKAPVPVCPTQQIYLVMSDDPREALAGEMKRCWDTWGKGELELFQREELVFCHVCSMVYVPHDAVEGLPQYLDNAKAPRAEGLSYAEYIAGTTSGERFREEDIPDSGVEVLPTEKPLGVIFYYAKGQDAFDALYNSLIGDPTTAATSGAAVGTLAGVAIVAAAPTGGISLVVLGVIYAAAATTGAAAGGFGGLLASLFGRADLDFASAVVVRPLAEADIISLNCQYAPAANS